jgi:hypothetical protein
MILRWLESVIVQTPSSFPSTNVTVERNGPLKRLNGRRRNSPSGCAGCQRLQSWAFHQPILKHAVSQRLASGTVQSPVPVIEVVPSRSCVTSRSICNFPSG